MTKVDEQSANPKDWLRCYPRRAEDGRIDWSQTAEYVYRLIRASSHPRLPALYDASEGNQKVRIWNAQSRKSTGSVLAPFPDR